MNSLLIYLIIGLIIGGLLAYFILKANRIARSQYDELQQRFTQKEAELTSLSQRLEEKNELALEGLSEIKNLKTSLEASKEGFLKASTAEKALHTQVDELKTRLKILEEKLAYEQEKQIQLNRENSELVASKDSLAQKLATQKEEIEQLHHNSQLKFEQLANKILEEKTEKFTTANQEGLKQILTPFKENVEELKKKVAETYDKEAKERFSLGERVKELLKLNQQISEEAKNLTHALKGEAKTQGNWGEMILESILEKSGLRKGKEYFMEYQLTDEENKPLRSDIAGKKMRPDAVVKYPGGREVIIDSKVSLTAFTRLVEATDKATADHEMQLHLTSLRNHINTLSSKGYDDYRKSLDFVIMFVPSEPAYIAAMQGDANLWQYAYDKRILLLSPTNLITSLKLIADLWKREYQNENAMQIAERGAKLYDKFVGFVENLDKVGRSLKQTNTSFKDAYKQLYNGRDNLVRQAEKLKELGVKSKKQLNQQLVDNAHNPIDLSTENNATDA